MRERAVRAVGGGLAAAGLTWLAHLLLTGTVDYVAAYQGRPPQLYVDVAPVVVNVPTPSWGLAALLLVGWLLGVAYGIYLAERRYNDLSLRSLLDDWRERA